MKKSTSINVSNPTFISGDLPINMNLNNNHAFHEILLRPQVFKSSTQFKTCFILVLSFAYVPFDFPQNHHQEIMSSSTMTKKLQKFFHYCLSKLKNSRPQIHPSSSSPIKRILSGCKQPKTPSFAVARGKDDDAATLSDVDRFLFENFKSLFLGDDEYTTENNNDNITDDGVSKENHGDRRSGSDPLRPMSPDLLGDVKSSGSGESIVLLAWSANQYEDFRRSMKEMVDATLRNHGRVDWGFMEELLLLYLNLNEKKSHKFVLSAYVDLINDFRESSSERAPAKAKPRSVRTFRTGREIGRSKVAIRAIEKQD